MTEGEKRTMHTAQGTMFVDRPLESLTSLLLRGSGRGEGFLAAGF